MPREASPAFVRVPFNFAAVAGTFADTDARVIADSFKPGFKGWIEKFVLTLGPVAGAGAGGTQTFVLRKGGVAGTALASITVAVAEATVGKVFEAAVATANEAVARFSDSDTFSITRTIGGTTFTTEPLGSFTVIARQRPQERR